MKIIAKDNPVQRKLVPEGTHPARVVQVIHMGTVDNYFGEPKNTVRITFEFPTQKAVFKEEDGEQPFWRSQDCTLNFGELSTLRKIAKACGVKPKKDDKDGLEYMDVTDLLDKTLLISVEHKESKKGSMYEKLTTYSPLIAGMEVPKTDNDLLMYSVYEHDKDVYESLPDWLKEKIATSWEFKNISDTPDYPSDEDMLEAF